MDEVEVFHKQLLINRQERLSRQQIKLNSEINKLNDEILAKSSLLDQLLLNLNGLQAFDQLLSVTNRLATYKAELDGLLRFKELVKTYKDELAIAKRELISSNIEAEAYLAEDEDNIYKATELFRSLGKLFYPDNTSIISIVNNDGDNQKRYNFEPIIDNDSSDGINEVKIFCYDMNMLNRPVNHNFSFIFHDSRLFGDIDFRKLPVLFEFAYLMTMTDKKQYICTINQGHLDQMRANMPEDKYAAILENNIVLRLSDEDAEYKLLGYQTTLRY